MPGQSYQLNSKERTRAETHCQVSLYPVDQTPCSLYLRMQVYSQFCTTFLILDNADNTQIYATLAIFKYGNFQCV